MTKSRPIVRPATKEDVEAFAPNLQKPSLRAWAGEIDGKVIAIGGVAFVMGRWVAFLDMTDEARPFKITLARSAIRFFDELRREGIKYIYAEADLDEPTSLAWLARLGFDHQTNNLFRWSA